MYCVVHRKCVGKLKIVAARPLRSRRLHPQCRSRVGRWRRKSFVRQRPMRSSLRRMTVVVGFHAVWKTYSL